ncbi:unnamed protein product [Amaranthus hypochondriacus]
MTVKSVPWVDSALQRVLHEGVGPQKTRGRPKKRHQPSTVPPVLTPVQAELEASETWEMAKLLGVSSSDEPAVLSHLCKSKRLLIMEQGVCPHG